MWLHRIKYCGRKFKCLNIATKLNLNQNYCYNSKTAQTHTQFCEQRTKKRYIYFVWKIEEVRKEPRDAYIEGTEKNDDGNQFVCDNIIFRRIFIICSFNLDWFFPPKSNRPTLLCSFVNCNCCSFNDFIDWTWKSETKTQRQPKKRNLSSQFSSAPFKKFCWND